MVKAELHPTYKWIRNAGIASELLGWGSAMLAGQFLIGAIFIYLGFLLLAIDPWIEPDLRGKTLWKLLITFFMLLFAAAFSWGMVFIDHTLDITGLITDAEYAQGTKIGDITSLPTAAPPRFCPAAQAETIFPVPKPPGACPPDSSCVEHNTSCPLFAFPYVPTSLPAVKLASFRNNGSTSASLSSGASFKCRSTSASIS
jgi:hypothetical protein